MDSDFPRGHQTTSLTTLVDVVAPPPVGDPRLIGRRLEGRYEILRALDRGGMATVYVALDHRLDREVAVKVMHPSLAHDPAFVGRFRREAKAAASIRHRNVVAVTDTGEDGGEVFLVMDLVRGRTLRALLTERSRLDPARALEVAESVLAALDAAHRAGLVHRDVKPENVLLGDDGTIAVADFGLARAIEASSLTTHAGLLLGTVAYVAPEQVEHGRADARSDVYAAGVMLFEMLTGRVPYDADTAVTVAFRHVHEDVPAPSALAAGVPGDVDDLVLAATARDPDERYADAGAFLAAVRRVRPRLRPPRPDTAALNTAALDTAASNTAVLGTGVRDTAVLDAAPADPRAAETVTLPPRAGTTATTRVVVPPPPDRTPDRTADGTPEKARRRRRRWPWVLAVVVLLSVGAGAGGWWLARDAKTRVPALSDRSLSAVQASLTSHHLAWRLGTSAHSDTIPSGDVVTTAPPPGSAVARHSVVVIEQSSGVLMVPVPTVQGSTQAVATAALAAAQLATPHVTAAYSDTVATGLVIDSNPRVGQTVSHLTSVTLVVSRGPVPVAIPDERGATLADAERTLASLHLKAAVTQDFSDTVPAGTVITATPSSGTGHHGDTVRLEVSKGPQLVTLPDLTVYDGNQADQVLRQLGLVPHEVALFGIHGGAVVTQSPKAGNKVKIGSTVTFYTAY